MDSSAPIGLIELVVVLAFALGWGILELVSLRMDDKKKAEQAARAELDAKADASKEASGRGG